MNHRMRLPYRHAQKILIECSIAHRTVPSLRLRCSVMNCVIQCRAVADVAMQEIPRLCAFGGFQVNRSIPILALLANSAGPGSIDLLARFRRIP